MIQTLPKRSCEAFAAFRAALHDLRASLVCPRPLTQRMVVAEVDNLIDLSSDLETDVLADLAELAELAARWELDDVVQLTSANGKAVFK